MDLNHPLNRRVKMDLAFRRQLERDEELRVRQIERDEELRVKRQKELEEEEELIQRTKQREQEFLKQRAIEILNNLLNNLM